MVQPEFEEKQFEDCHKELLKIDDTQRMYPVGQYLEHFLGVDTRAMLTPYHPLWSIIGTTYGTGTPLNMSNVSRCVNVFLQYKRATYHPPPRSTYYYHFQNTPYYSFKVSSPAGQLNTLLHLANEVDDEYSRLAVVRYVAPRFHTEEELWTSRDEKTLLQRSAYVRPREFRSGTGKHTACFYTADVTTDALFNPEPEPGSVESHEYFMGNVTRMRSYPESFSTLSRVVQFIDPKPRRPPLDMPNSSIERDYPGIVRNVLTIAWFAYRNNLQWLIYAD
ncbi:hypothetical protein [Mycobacteroides abscessus]|uniref:hypothetical protein n=1 Tax=Mycobacteroides abscessus TaxID=36809 RepID=UPI0012FFF34A|nr:hypothetical protein [Mycobacteroides abscessus]